MRTARGREGLRPGPSIKPLPLLLCPPPTHHLPTPTHTYPPTHQELLRSAIFCGAMPGDGYSARLEDSLMNGCIPVIIQDYVHLAFESYLDFDAFSIRCAALRVG